MRVITINDQELTHLVEQAVTNAIQAELAAAGRGRKLVSGIKHIAQELGVSERKLSEMISKGELRQSIARSGGVYICDVNEAFDELQRKTRL